MGSVNLEAEAAKRRSDVVEWLRSLFPDFDLPLEASDEELRARLSDGSVFSGILRRLNTGGYLQESQNGSFVSSEKRMEGVRTFLSAVDEMGLPGFKVSDLEQGSMSAVVACILSLRDHLNYDNREGRLSSLLNGSGNLSRKRWNLLEGNSLQLPDFSRGQITLHRQISVGSGEARKSSLPELKFQQVLRGPITSEPSSPMSHHAGHKFHEVFQLKQGRYSDIPAAKISEMMKSNSLDNAPTQSLLSVVNGILDESIERKNGEIPQRVACLLRKVVQEIERRISTQAEHIRNQNNLIKAREEKYQSRIKVLETLATGTSEETQIIMNQLQLVKAEKSRIEERKKIDEQDVVRLLKEKENSDKIISELQQNLETTEKSYAGRYQQLETKANETKRELEERIKEVEFHLAESRRKAKELEAFSESKFRNWNQKQHVFQNFIGLQLQSVQDLRASSESIKHDILKSQRVWSEEFIGLGKKLKALTDAAENYHIILAENRKLFNEVQELKGNIRVYCRIRPFLCGENTKSTTIDYIGENGELLVVNPTKQGKDGHRMFKFNKVFGPAATQEQVFVDIQPLIRSVLDGYNVCIFAYGQTGSGKTYTMTGPNSAAEKEWGVNYRALNDLFHISRNRRNTYVYEVGVQMVEIYNEQVRDLLANDTSQKRLGILNTSQPNGMAVPDATMLPVKSTSDVLELMQIGLTNRAVGATALNERSSRSHSVVTVHVRGSDLKTGASLRGSLHLVDLAGSERVDRSEVTGDRLKEAQHINKSLSALGDVIFSLSQKSAHVPYRNSKLTQLLQTSLGGQAKTLMFVQINPDVKSFSETYSTLKFAERVSGVELGAARSNKEGKDVRDLMEQVASLKDTIARKDEEIEQLQSLKDIKSQSPRVNSERHGSNLLRHSSSSPRISLLGGAKPEGRRLSGEREVVSNKKAASDPGNCSNYSDKHSEAGSHQSADDSRHQKENLSQSELAGEDASRSLPVDLELLGFGDADSEERLSDISDGGLSMGTETDGSAGSVVEFALFPEHAKPAEITKEKKTADPSRISRTLPRNLAQTSTRTKTKDSLRTPSLRRSTTSQVVASLAKTSKRWQ